MTNTHLQKICTNQVDFGHPAIGMLTGNAKAKAKTHAMTINGGQIVLPLKNIVTT
jgi:hypothetical protein